MGEKTTWTDRSGQLEREHAPKMIMMPNPSRAGWMLQNQSNGDIWVSDLPLTAAPRSPSIRVSPGETYFSPGWGCPTGPVTAFSTAPNQVFAAREASWG